VTIHEFAELAGVTVKALHHYDRLGLLKPARTCTGYRIYTGRDLERLEQIVALKFLGLPLKQIKTLLDRDPLQLPAALRLQRTVLEEKRRLIDRAIEAITSAEDSLRPGQPTQNAVLRKIIEVIEMQNAQKSSHEFMKNYYREEAWQRFRQRHVEWPSQSWHDLFRDISVAIGEDPAGETAQALAHRWRVLRVKDAGGDPRIHEGLIKAWADRRYWPEDVQNHFAAFDLDAISAFIGQAFRSYREKRYGDPLVASQLERFTREERESHGLVRAGLYFLLAEAVDEDPKGSKAQALAARWMELIECVTGYKDPPQKDYEAMIGRIQSWPPTFVQQLAVLDREKIGGFILRALAAV
jgi:MerR family transcriptional regulator, thiopeptide resistance regulator